MNTLYPYKTLMDIKILFYLSRVIGVPFFKMYNRIECIGIDNVPRQGPMLVVSNHSSFLDPYFLSAVFPAGRIQFLTTTRFYYKNWITNLFFSLNGCIPISNHKLDESSKKILYGALNKNNIVGIFPEGIISKDGKLNNFRPGAIQIARQTGAPIIPAALCGTFHSLPVPRKFPKPTKVRVIFGKPLRFAPVGSENNNNTDLNMQEMEKIKVWIQEQIDRYS